MTELEEQEVPTDPKCPYCGGEPEYDPKHQLSAIGYLHDDISYDCSECGENWVHGHPIGTNESKLAENLHCDACEDSYARVHRIEFADDEHGVRALRLHLKCPDCYHFWKWDRDVESGQRTVLVGHPATTGSIEDAEDTTTYSEDEV